MSSQGKKKQLVTLSEKLAGKTAIIYLKSSEKGEVRGRIIESDADFVKVDTSAGDEKMFYPRGQGYNRFVTIPVMNIRTIHTKE